MKARLVFRRAQTPVAPAPRLVYLWDLDKTYLKSDFDSLRELVKIPFEKAEDKIAAPGVTALIRGLRNFATRNRREVRVYFISASPPQIARAITEKLALDGVVYDGIVFKDQLQRLMHGKFRHLREQVGFKLTELLKSRRQEPPAAREYLFGDDWESDPLIYSLYADAVAGRVAPDELADVLRALRVDPPLIDEACALVKEVDHADAVARIFINLERRTPPANFHSFGFRLVPTFNYLQTAACLYEEGVLDQGGVAEVARSLLEDSAYSADRLANSLADVERRGHLSHSAALLLGESLRVRQLLPDEGLPRRMRWRAWWQCLRARLRAPQPPAVAAAPASINYRAMVAGELPAESHSAG